MKKYLSLLVVIAVMFSATLSYAAEKNTWRLFLQINDGPIATLGASDFGYGYSKGKLSEDNIYYGLGDGTYQGIMLYGGSRVVATEVLNIWCAETAPDTFKLRWWTEGAIGGTYSTAGVWPDDVRLSAFVIRTTDYGWSEALNIVPKQKGEKELPFIGAAWGRGYAVVINANAPAVPEPGSIAALSTGLIGLGGLVVKKRK